jgi:hypothetical protein
MSWRQVFAVIAVIGCCAAGPVLFVVARPPLTGRVSVDVDEPVDSATVARGLGMGDYFTGFEPEEGFIPRDPNFPASGFSGWINGQPWNPVPQLNWAVTSNIHRSDREGHIDAVNPYAGLQHVRISPVDRADLCPPPKICEWGLGVDVRIPASADVLAQPVGPYRVECQVAISALNGQDFRIQPQSNTQGFLSTSMYFLYQGGIYVLDRDDVTTGLFPTGFTWDTTGEYQNLTIDFDPCANHIDYYYAGAQIYESEVHFGTALEQFLVFGDNYPGSHLDLDNVSLTRGVPCPMICGDGYINIFGGEDCETDDDSNCPGRCISSGQVYECTCIPICTPSAPCVLETGSNGPFILPCDRALGCFFIYGTDTQAAWIDTCGSTFNADIEYWGSNAEPPHLGSSNSSCCNPSTCGYEGYDSYPLAECYSESLQMASCTCKELSTAGNIQFEGVIRSPFGSDRLPGQSLYITVGNTDTCCVPDCTGRKCGNDRCGGVCGTCNNENICDGMEICHEPSGQCQSGTPLICSDGNACNGTEICNSAMGGCQSGTSPNCDDGLFCNGLEFCFESHGCLPGQTPCSENEFCDELTDECRHPTIPATSAWGLTVLALILLIGGKIHFGCKSNCAA